MKATDQQQLGILSRNVLPLLKAVVDGYSYDPGDSDLDNEQPIHVRMTLGDYRRASNLKYELEKPVMEREFVKAFTPNKYGEYQ